MTTKPRILLVDDDEAFLELFSPLGAIHDVELITMTSAKKALDLLSKERVDLLVTDVQMPGMTGMELFATVQTRRPDIPVILITAFGSTEEAIQAVKQGAFHYFEKPLFNKLDLFWATVRESLAKRNMQQELLSLRKEKSLKMRSPTAIIGKSATIKKVMRSIKEVAPLPVTILITGETGVGKELVARAIHDMSDRRDKPFFAVSCTELTSSAMETELFGHERGGAAYSATGNVRRGLFEVANGGTFFLDEIGEASPSLQSKLLRVVETKSFLRVGGTSSISSDFRLIVSTNRNLEEEVMAGRFRQDLYYRLSVYVLEVPPLRVRKDDVPLLVDYYTKRFSEAYHRKIIGITGNAMLALRQYNWPGNVRELVNVIERAIITTRDGRIAAQCLPFGTEEFEDSSDLSLHEGERLLIEMALRRMQGNRTRAAKLLGISRKTLIEKLKLYKVEDEMRGRSQLEEDEGESEGEES